MRTAEFDLEPVAPAEARDPSRRSLYLEAAMKDIPRLLGAMDRNPYRATYGCLDRQFWHYRTSDFPSEMYQEGVWPLALVYAHPLPGNRWFHSARVRELAIAGVRFTARSCHRDGSCDDYYPFERALGAAVFSLNAAAQTYRLLELDDSCLLRWFRLRADWLLSNGESGRLANHHALAALSLLRVAEITGVAEYREAAEAKLRRVLAWQSPEGWFEEYGGADPGYQTVTIDCLVQCRARLNAAWLDEPIRRGVAFCRWFLHADHSYGGEYGSRGTYHFYPHGFELLATENGDAADLADGFLEALAAGKQAHFDDDRLFAHRLGNLIEAWLDWSPERAISAYAPPRRRQFFSQAQILVDETPARQTIASAARGGAFKHFDRQAEQHVAGDAGLIVELDDGQVAVSQSHDLGRQVDWQPERSALRVGGALHYASFETATPLKFMVLRMIMISIGRYCRTLVRRLLQKRVITGRRAAPVRLTRSIELLEPPENDRPALRVTDRIELLHRRARVRRMAFGVDHQAAYVAASGVYQDSVLEPWSDLSSYVDRLNTQRSVTIVRQW